VCVWRVVCVCGVCVCVCGGFGKQTHLQIR